MDDVASPELLDTPMPKLMLLTSVENSFKYALKLYEIMNLLIKVDRWEENGQTFVRLIVEDDGDGYPEEMLRGFEQFTGSSAGSASRTSGIPSGCGMGSRAGAD